MFVGEKKNMPDPFIFCVLEELNAFKSCKGKTFGKENQSITCMVYLRFTVSYVRCVMSNDK